MMKMKTCSIVRNKLATTETVIINYLFKVKNNESATSRFLASLLEEKGKFYNSPSEMAKAFSALYGSQLHTSIALVGNLAIFTVRLIVPYHKFIGEDVFLKALALVKDVMEDVSEERYLYPMLQMHKSELIKHAKELENRAIEMGRFKVFAQVNPRANVSKPSYGTIKDVKKVTTDAIKAMHQRMLKGEISICGETPKSVTKTKKEILEIFKPKKKKLPNKFEVFTSDEIKESELTQKNISQSAVYLLYKFNKTSSEFASLYKSALHNELFEIVREQHGYCYLIDCSVIMIHNLLLVRAYTSLKNVDNSVDLIKKIIDKFILNDENLNSAKLKRINQLETIKENLIDINSYTILRRIIGERYDINENLMNISGISLDDVNQVPRGLNLISVVKVKEVNDHEN